MRSRLWLIFVVLFALPLAAATPDMPQFRWENFTTANGLPNDHVFCVLVDGEHVWAGTEDGLALYEGGKWKIFRL
jgi:ligand-binding sensor domain-containing protein